MKNKAIQTNFESGLSDRNDFTKQPDNQNIISENKLFVVLGMHRSGTSTITRSLLIFDISIGDNLIEGLPDNNEKGFFEDAEINAFNNALLERFGSSWSHIGIIEPRQVDQLVHDGALLDAVEILRRKLFGNKIFAFKDPRVSKLLPFWKMVFENFQVNPTYIIAVRNPLSIAKSLFRRDKMSPEKVYYLWLTHIVTALNETNNSNRILVSYDSLVDGSDREIQRLSEDLELSVDAEKLYRFKNDFLEQRLRHTVFTLNDLKLDSKCPALVFEIYSTLLDCLEGGLPLTSKKFKALASKWADELARVSSLLNYNDLILGENQDLSNQLVSQEQVALTLSSNLSANEILLNNAQSHITRLEQVVGERDDSITTLSQEKEALVQAVDVRNLQITHLEQVVGERDDSITTLSQEKEALVQAVDVRNLQITHLEQVVGERDHQIKAFSCELESIYKSKSWALTKPFRFLRSKLNVISPPYTINEGQYQILKQLAGLLPIKPPLRSRLRSHLKLHSVANLDISCDDLDLVHESGKHLITDHNQLWLDYQPLKQAIKNNKQTQISSVDVKPIALIDFSQSDLLAVAKKLKFTVTEMPKVSILLPVFESIHMTLECLESISQSKVCIPYEIIVADDASNDQTAEILSYIDGISTKTQSQNRGFLRNCNDAFDLVRGEYVVILNSDVQVTEGWLDKLLEIFSEYPDAGTVGPKIIYPSGHLQEAGVTLEPDGTAVMIGLNDDPSRKCYSYVRAVDYCSGACLMIKASLFKDLQGFSDEFAPAYYEDADLGMKVLNAGYKNYFASSVTVVHHLSKTMEKISPQWKKSQAIVNGDKFYNKWAEDLDLMSHVQTIAFYLPQFHAIDENDKWWGKGFTEWTNVRKAKPNFIGHYQPRVPSDLGYYDLTDIEVMKKQIALAQKYGVNGFCFYYYWFDGKRLLEAPVDLMLESELDFPFCLCWANENWSRRWDGKDNDILIGQNHSPEDDRLVILDLIRYFKSNSYIRINNKPLLLIYRVDLFPNFKETSLIWREICRREGIGEVYLALVESHDLVHKNIDPSIYGCDASVEFPPLNMAEQIPPSGDLLNTDFSGGVGDYRKTLLSYCARELPSYKRFRGVMPGWDNTARRQNNGFLFEHSSPGAFQAWLEFVMEQTRQNMHGDERIVFINAWNEWAEGAYLEPDLKNGHAFLEAVRNAYSAKLLSSGEGN